MLCRTHTSAYDLMYCAPHKQLIQQSNGKKTLARYAPTKTTTAARKKNGLLDLKCAHGERNINILENIQTRFRLCATWQVKLQKAFFFYIHLDFPFGLSFARPRIYKRRLEMTWTNRFTCQVSLHDMLYFSAVVWVVVWEHTFRCLFAFCVCVLLYCIHSALRLCG